MNKRILAGLAALLLLAGCAAPVEPEPVSPVHTDWSKLEPYAPDAPETLYTTFEPHSGSGSLQARSDYGTLLPYVGSVVQVDNYILDKLPLYGLVTADGQAVTAPVYAEIQSTGDFLVLYRGNFMGYQTYGDSRWATGDFTYTVAAPDGSWTREFPHGGRFFPLDDAHLTMVNGRDVTVLDDQGGTAAFFPAAALEPYLGKDFSWWDQDTGADLYVQDGKLCLYRFDEAVEDWVIPCWLDITDGSVHPGAPEPKPPEPEESEPTPPAVEGYNYLDPIVDSLTGEVYYFSSHWDERGHHCDLLSSTGQVVCRDLDLDTLALWQPIVRAGLVSTAEDGCFCYRSLTDGSLVFRYPLRSNLD